MVEILKVVDECCRDLSVIDIGESSLRASGEAEELRRWSDGARALGDAGGWLVVTLVPFAVWIDGEGMGRRGVMQREGFPGGEEDGGVRPQPRVRFFECVFFIYRQPQPEFNWKSEET